MRRVVSRRSPPPSECSSTVTQAFSSPPAECRALYGLYKEQVRKMDADFSAAHAWLHKSVDDAIASFSEGFPTKCEPLIGNSPASGRRKLRKRASKSVVDTSVPSMNKMTKKRKTVVALAAIDEIEVSHGQKQSSEPGSPIAAAPALSDSKVVTPAKPPRRRNAPRIASVNATKKITLDLLEEKKDPTKLTYTKRSPQSLDDQNDSVAGAGSSSTENYPRGDASALPKVNGTVSKRVIEYEEKIAVASPSRVGQLTPTLAAAVDTEEEDEEEIPQPLRVSKAILQLSNQTNNNISPKVTCSPLNMNRLSVLRTSNGTYCLNGTTFIKFQKSATGRVSGRRRSASDRFKRRSELSALSVVLMESMLPGTARNSGTDVRHASLEDADENSHDAKIDDAVDVAASTAVNGSDDTSDAIPSTLASVAKTSILSRQTSTPATQSRNPFALRSQVSSLMATDISTSQNRNCSGYTDAGSRKQLKRHLVQADSAKPSSAQRERTQVRAMQDVMERLNALKMKEEKTIEVLKKRDYNMKLKIDSQKKKREERLRKAMLARREAQKQKALKLKELQQQEELKRIQAVSAKKREQEENEQQQRLAEQRRLNELHLAERERQRERGRGKILKAESEALAQREVQLMGEEREREREMERVLREQSEVAHAQEQQRFELEKKRLQRGQQLQRAWAVDELNKKEAELKAMHLKVCVIKHPSNEKPSKEAADKAEAHNVVVAPSAMAQPLNSTFTKEPMPSTSANVCTSYEITPKRDPSKTIPNTNPNNYDIADIQENDSTDDESRPKKEIPAWAQGRQLRDAALKQYYNPPDYAKIFPASELMRAPKLAEMFQTSKPRYFARTSSANWSSPLFQDDSFADYRPGDT